MNKVKLASELVKLAKELTAAGDPKDGVIKSIKKVQDLLHDAAAEALSASINSKELSASAKDACASLNRAVMDIEKQAGKTLGIVQDA